MTCQICEMRLARDDADGEVQEHLERCPACRAMAEELRENAEALSALQDEPLPALELPRRRRAYAWIAAAAAAVVLMAAPRLIHRETPSPPVSSQSAKTRTLKIKMLTPDPDVVIYWMVEGE
jgi:ferric-dicitrate binding protein FerR (iron transport regulator)